jgi:hypothetical protein
MVVKMATAFIFTSVFLFVVYFFREIRFVRLVWEFFESPQVPLLIKGSGFFGLAGVLMLVSQALFDVFGKKDKYGGVEK